MLFRGARALFLTALAVSASGQEVISTRSGVIHYFEGAVSLNDQPLEPRLGRFPSMSEGAELRTAQGRAEVLLTPGVILRIDQNSAIRMLSNSLADSRVELLTGSAMIESAEPEAGTSVTLTYRDWQVRFPQKGVYRIDSSPACVRVHEGEAEVTDAATGEPVAIERGMDLPLAAALVPEQTVNEAGDALSSWARGRADSISADNQIAANIQDPASMGDANAVFGDPSQYGFTQFPLLGLTPMSAAVPGVYGTPGVYSPYGGMYGSPYPYQPGFYSLYLPGYTYRPLSLVLPSVGRSPLVYSPPRTGSTITRPRPLGSVYSSPALVRPAPITHPAPMVHPVAPRPVTGHR
jgi:hypothetical protein